MIKRLALVAVLCSLTGFSVRAQTVQKPRATTDETVSTDTRTVEERLTDLERKVDKILKAVTVGQRTGVAKYVERELPNIEKSIRDIERDLDRVSDNVRSIKSGR